MTGTRRIGADVADAPRGWKQVTRDFRGGDQARITVGVGLGTAQP